MKVKKNHNEIIGEKIRERREQLKVSREELAKQLGYKNSSSIAKIETGACAINVSDLVAVSKILRYDLDLLCSTSSAPGVVQVRTKKYGHMMITLNENETNSLMDMLMPNLSKHLENEAEAGEDVDKG